MNYATHIINQLLLQVGATKRTAKLYFEPTRRFFSDRFGRRRSLLAEMMVREEKIIRNTMNQSHVDFVVIYKNGRCEGQFINTEPYIRELLRVIGKGKGVQMVIRHHDHKAEIVDFDLGYRYVDR